MESTPRQSESRDPLGLVLTVLTALVVVAVGLVGYVIYDNSLGSDASPSRAIELGDTVTMNYIGMFQDGRVFDTSIWDVAIDNAAYPKSLTYSIRTEDTYVPFDMEAGKYGESGGTIKGFALGVIGMILNERKVIVVAPEDGYAVNETMLEDVPVLEEIPIVQTITEDEYRQTFEGNPVEMAYVDHYKWGWECQIIEVQFGFVTFKNLPLVDDLVYPYGNPGDADSPAGWECTVESYDPSADDGVGRILVRHGLTEEDVYNVKGVEHDGTVFVVSALDSESGTFQIHRSDPETGYNGEISGRTLLFEVTIINIKPG